MTCQLWAPHVFSLLAQVAATPAAPASSVWSIVLKGGWTMIPLALCSIVAMTVIVDRLIITRRARVAPPALLNALSDLRNDPRRALARCLTDPSPLAGIIAAALKSSSDSRQVQEARIRETGERELVTLRRRMRLLSALPQTATMLGLLGTVLGMIRTFTVVAASGESLGKTERLAKGIYEAWTATAGGLVIAIPTLIMYQILMARIDAAAAALDSAAARWLDGPMELAAVPEPDEHAPSMISRVNAEALVGASG